MIDYGTAFLAALQLLFMVIGACTSLVGIIWLVRRAVITTGNKSAQALLAVVGVVGVLFAMSLILYFGGDPAAINGMVHGDR